MAVGERVWLKGSEGREKSCFKSIHAHMLLSIYIHTFMYK